MTVYGEILFLIGGFMDILCLWMTQRLTGLMMKPSRCLLGSTVGALTGVLFPLLAIPPAVQAILAVPVSVLMVLCAFGCCGGAWDLARTCGILWGVTAMTGGTVAFLLSALAVSRRKAALFLALAAGAVISVGFWRLVRWQRKRSTVQLAVTLGERTVRFRALCDSGDLAEEPLSGRPVLFVASEAARELLPEGAMDILCGDGTDDPEALPAALQKRCRAIPLRNTSGASLALGVLPDRVQLEDKRAVSIRAILVFRRGSRSFFGGSAGLLPAAAIPSGGKA